MLNSSAMTTEHILLAGAGDLCLRAARLLLAQGHQVWGLRRRPPGNETSGIHWIAGDLTQIDTLQAIPRSISQVIYAPAPGARNEMQYRAVFLQGLENLLATLDSATLERFLFISSTAVYGPSPDKWADENTPPAPTGFNGRVLLEAEQYLTRHQTNSILFRLAGLYGPDRTELLTRLRQGRVSVPRNTVHWANRFHIDDAAHAAVHLLNLEAPHACYIGVDDHPHSQVQLYDALADLFGVARPADSGAGPDVASKRLSNARLRASGYQIQWPDAIAGYRAIINAMPRN